jgi:hypothetical protein
LEDNYRLLCVKPEDPVRYDILAKYSQALLDSAHMDAATA